MNELLREVAVIGLDPDYLPPCPACSFRVNVRAPSFRWARHSGGYHLSQCCVFAKAAPIVECREMPIGADVTSEMRKRVADEQLAARVEVANWWKKQRLTGNRDMLEYFRSQGLTPEMEAPHPASRIPHPASQQ
jgi:hypothetical protein